MKSKYDTETENEAYVRYDQKTGRPLNPGYRYDPQTGRPLNPVYRYDMNTDRPLSTEYRYDMKTGKPLKPGSNNNKSRRSKGK